MSDELKHGFAFGCVPTMRYAANSVLAFNLMRGFQLNSNASIGF